MARPFGYFGRRGAFRRVSWDEKSRASAIVQRAIRRGDLVRPETCSVCGKRMVGRGSQRVINAHHRDYSKPLDVMWLCPRCHADEHARLNEEASDGREIERHVAARDEVEGRRRVRAQKSAS